MPTRNYNDWFKVFIEGKREVPLRDSHDKYIFHSASRYVDDLGGIWEVAFTYTGRLVVRAGKIGPDGLTVLWTEWVTEHAVEVPGPTLLDEDV